MFSDHAVVLALPTRRLWSAIVQAVAALVAFCLLMRPAALAQADGPIAIEHLDRNTPVDFQTEILPILRANCSACHSSAKAEAELSLESPASILKGGGQGPAVVPGRSGESLLLKVAAHQEESFMPPADNEVGARQLTSAELGLIELWITQGAAGELAPPRPVTFQPLPAGSVPIFAAAVTANGQYAACARGTEVHVYHAPTQQIVARLEGHADVVRSLAFDPTGQWLASGGFRQVKLWRRPHLQAVATAKVDGKVTAAATDSTGRLVAVGTDNGRIVLPNENGEAKDNPIEAHAERVTGIVLLPDGQRLISAAHDGTIRLANITAHTAGPSFKSPSPISSLALVNHAKSIATGHEDNVVRIWDVDALLDDSESTTPRMELQGHSGPVTSLAAAGDGAIQLVSGGEDGTLRLWNVDSGEQIRQWNHGEKITAVAIKSDGSRIASAGGKSLKLWQADSGESVVDQQGNPLQAAEVAHLEAEIAFMKSAISLGENDIKSYEGPQRRIMTTKEAVKKAEDEELAKAEKAIKEKQEALDKAKEKSDEKAIERAEKELQEANTSREVALTIIERAKIVAERAVVELAEAEAKVARNKEALQQLEMQREAAKQSADEGIDDFQSLAFSADGKRLLAGTQQGIVHCYDAAFGAPLESSSGNEAPGATCFAGGNGTLMLGSSGGELKIFQAAGEWTLDHTIGSIDDPATIIDRVLSLAFSPDGQFLAVGSGLPARSGQLKIFRSTDGQLERELAGAHADTVLALAYSADAKYLASGSADRMVKLHNAADGTLLHTLAGHTAHVTGASFSGDASMLVSSGGDRVLKLWNVESGTPIQTMKGTTYRIGPYRGEITAAAFIGNSEQILAASGDGTVRLHRTSSENDILTFADSTGYIYCAAASADGRVVIAGGADGVLRLWSGHERSPKATLLPPQ